MVQNGFPSAATFHDCVMAFKLILKCGRFIKGAACVKGAAAQASPAENYDVTAAGARAAEK
jgi:hypothetical protein